MIDTQSQPYWHRVPSQFQAGHGEKLSGTVLRVYIIQRLVRPADNDNVS